MKIKQIIYFFIILAGALVISFQSLFNTKEYALIIGIILLMFGIYKMSTSWKEDQTNHKDSEA
ncbi:hypothetical protein SAMN05660703_2891 [Cellulophaga tyrosinoxydans]|jgi:cadmium resistance protein CadD (predicted permease)|uniref:Uncharacterized protein n=1 Tax=Cellulophaga tyrosinoxydans TaxID=504486 RepID=A0A1W2CD51_9FLAO|nr:hypothetical protein SAMN05660703_2891 [Cellulophaga tyrosinoxydans]|tara:strand:+ start:400 stop:588 length:189 start_codon:yes stop_codon:yes gene_type:complete